jgi:hypothetical protein
MGEVLLKYYKFVTDEVGLKGKIQLSKLTKVPSTRAALEEDSERNIKIFREAVVKITQKEPPQFLK